MSKDSRKSRKPRKSANGGTSRQRSSKAREEIVEPEDLEPVDDEDEDEDQRARATDKENFDVEIEGEIDDDLEDEDEDRGARRHRRRNYRGNDFFGPEGPFGADGPFGPGGPFGPSGPFGPGGAFGKKGMFGPGGLFAKSGMNRGERGEGRRDGPRRRRMFGPGELRLVLLAMLAEEPRHGYELIKALEDMTAGAYSPSPGTIYPTLQMLADEGAIAEKDSDDAKKLYQATETGLAELEERKDEIEDLWERLGRKREKARPKGSAELFRAMSNLGTVLKNKAASGGLKDMDKDKVIDLIDELARKIERL